MIDLPNKRIFVAVTGASGSIYAERLLQCLRGHVGRIYLSATDSGLKVAAHELKGSEAGSLRALLSGNVEGADRDLFRIFQNDDLFVPIASGSSAPTHMVIVPCSMGTLARIATGVSGNLIERAADVCLKQKVPLTIVPRETPFSTIHIRNMLTLSEMGVQVIPAMPAFYQKPQTVEDMVDFVVGRILESAGINHDLYPPWNSRMR